MLGQRVIIEKLGNIRKVEVFLMYFLIMQNPIGTRLGGEKIRYY
jgi:hypothetical protein